MRDRMLAMVKQTQDEICNAISSIDDSDYREDEWKREGGGGGRSRVFSSGSIFDKAGVNVSAVHGKLSEEAAARMGGGIGPDGSLEFFATGVSLVLHPKNPMAPTVHSNYRYFERGEDANEGSWWFGGGADLTPSYLFEDDAIHFHRTYKKICDRHPVADYGRFKNWCDEYFYNSHRKEGRGVGGIFFDDLREGGKEECFSFVEDCASGFLESYIPILDRRKGMQFDEAQKVWQRIRRGRYVEFNLIHDRGTKFGLRTDGRIESILMSLPLEARWEYCHEVTEGSDEDRLVKVLREPKDWV